ncbi:MAG TPA: FHA domain-containing protein [Kofleriaceae bacterium]
MPKAKPFPDNEDEEKTTIESQWEDEASTTVEQGDVADKIRSLNVAAARGGGTNVTSTGAGALDEPTVDDQHAQLSAITPVRDVARLQITQGNDAGNEIEIRPGKTYTIGRAIDNDVVLTDIAVSRKHFDLRFEDGAWVIVDRGSGNGTVVNGNLEDNPFMLANGDSIEIGNTVFRFDQPNAASRVNPQRAMDLDADDEEMSTVAGKPLRPELVDVAELHRPIGQRPTASRQAERPTQTSRPKTLPPPTPLRPSSASQPPPLGYPPPGPPSMPQPASTLPMAQMSNRPPPGLLPAYGPGAPAILGDPMPNLPGMLPTTLPGQGPPPQRPMFAYPQASEIPPHSVHAQMLLIQTQNRRGDASTAHVPPVPFEMVPQRYTQPQLTRKAKFVLLGIAVAVFTAVLLVALIKSNAHKPRATAGTGSAEKKTEPKKNMAAKTAAQGDAKTATMTQPTAPAKPTVAQGSPTPNPPAPAKTATTTVPPPAPAPAPAPPKTTVPSPAPAPTKTATTVPPPAPATAPAKTATTVPPPAPAPAPAKTATTVPPPAPAPAKVATTAPAPTPVKTVTPVKTAAKTDTAKTKARTKSRRNNEVPRRDTTVTAAAQPEPDPAPEPEPTRASGGSPDKALAEAKRLYQAKKFKEASAYLANQAKKFDESVAKGMRKTSEYYAKLGKAYAVGTAQGGRAIDAYEALRSARTYDVQLEEEFIGEINAKIGPAAGKAALLYIANRNYLAARTALTDAIKYGAGTETIDLVKSQLESAAGRLYSEALEIFDDNPSGAKDKLKTILQLVDPTSSWHKKATAKLKG